MFVAALLALSMSAAGDGRREDHARSVRSDGAQLVYRTTGSVSAQNPAPSPDGRWILFTRYVDGYDGHSGGLWKVPSGGGPARPVLDRYGATNVNASSSWARGEVAFADTAASLDGDIWTVAADGSGPRRLTNAGATAGHAYQEPTFASDGATIAFEDDVDDSRSSDGYVGALAVVARSGGPSRRILTSGDNRLPVWSPDGTRILFQRRTTLTGDGGYHLYTIHPDGTQLRQVTGQTSSGDHCDSDASWSPDGRWILDSAWYGSAGGCPDGDAEPKIYLVSVEGARTVQVTTNPDEEDGAPAMSPDGRWIYFESHRADRDDDSPAQLWRIRAP